MKKSILLICYSFPPNKGIGGRRWAKFAKHLSNEGYEVDVICKQAGANESSEWTADTQFPNIHLHPLAAKYPKILTTIPSSFFQKVEYKLWLIAFQYLSKGTFPERTFFWKKQLIKKASELIEKKKIKNVVVTVPPFRLGYYASFLKEKYPELNFILDYRDPWTDNRTFHGFMNLAPARMQHELNMEITAMKRADCIITANEQMTAWLKEKLNSDTKKRITIPNGYDKDDVKITPSKKVNQNGVTRFIYAGTFYSNVEYVLVPFLKAVKKQESAYPDFSERFAFDFYGDMDPAMRHLFEQYQLKSVHLNAPVRLNVVQQKIQESDFCLIFAAQDHAFAFNTKFYEYLANRKPIVIFSKQGEVPEFLEKNHLGIAIDYAHFEQDFEKMMDDISKNKIVFDAQFDTEQFSTLAHSKLLLKQLI